MAVTRTMLASSGAPPQESGAGLPRRLPKAELHLHLEGTIQPSTWLAILRRHHPNTRATIDDLRSRLAFRGMDAFFAAWMDLLYTLREPEDYLLAARECGRQLQRENVWYAELHTSVAGAHWSGRLNAHEVIPAIAEGLDAAHAEGGPQWRLIVDVIRDLCAERASQVGLDIALAHRHHGVVAVGLGGTESQYPAGLAAEAFAEAARHGLHRTAHAGEAAGPESIRAALEIGAERLGHAARAAEDPALVDELRRLRVPLEMCPTSNVLTGAVASLSTHPIGAFLRLGIRVSLNTDDPAFFHNPLSAEYAAVQEAFALSPSEMTTLARNAFEDAFLPEDEKSALLSRFDAACGPA